MTPKTSALMLAVLISKLGNQLMLVGLPLAVLQGTGSSVLAFLTLAARITPFALSPFLGVAIDRYSRLRVFLATEVVQMLAAIALAFTYDSNAFLLLLLMLISSAASITSNTIINFVLIPALTPEEKLRGVNAFFGSASQLIQIVGLPLGGLVYELFGAKPALLMNATSYLATMALLVLIKGEDLPAPSPKLPGLAAFRVGWRFVGDNPTLARLAIALGICNLGAGAMSIAVLRLAELQWAFDGTGVGAAMAVGALGGLVGAAAAGRVRADDGEVAGETDLRGLTVGLIVVFGGAVAMVPFGNSPIMLAGFFLLSVGEGAVNVFYVTLCQLLIPRDIAGRVNSLLRMVVVAPVPLAAIIQAALSPLPVWVGFSVAAAVVAVSALVWARRPDATEARRKYVLVDGGVEHEAQ